MFSGSGQVDEQKRASEKHQRAMSSRAACQLRMGTLVFLAQCPKFWHASFWHCASVPAVPILARQFFGTAPVCQLCQNVGTPVFWHCAGVRAVPILARKFCGTVPVRQLCQNFGTQVFSTVPVCQLCQNLTHQVFGTVAVCQLCQSVGTPALWHCAIVPASCAKLILLQRASRVSPSISERTSGFCRASERAASRSMSGA